MRAPRRERVEFRVAPAFRQDWRDRLAVHLVRLSAESRRNRFFVAMTDAALLGHARQTGPAAVVEARVDGEVRGIAEVHLRQGRPAEAEIALSVEDGWQRRGIGAALVARAVRAAWVCGAEEIAIHFLTGNAAMRRIVDRLGFDRAAGSDATLAQARLGARSGAALDLRRAGA